MSRGYVEYKERIRRKHRAYRMLAIIQWTSFSVLLALVIALAIGAAYGGNWLVAAATANPPRVKLVGYGCNGVPSGAAIYAVAEDDLPPCRDIRRILPLQGGEE